MIIETLTDAIKQNLGQVKSAPKGWFKRHCMLCQTQGHGKDTRNRFGIQYTPQAIVVNCFNCGFSAVYTEGENLSAKFKFFLQQIHIDEKFIKYVEFEIFKNKSSVTAFRDGSDSESAESKFKSLMVRWKPMDLPEGSFPISQWLSHGLDDPDFLEVVDHAIKRKVYDLDNFYWTPAKEFQLNRRLIIPYFYKKKIVGFTSRIVGEYDNKQVPKYYQQCPTDFVYNLDNQQDWLRKYVVVNEGVLDAWSTDGVGTLGEINQNKIDVINRLDKTVVVCADRDKAGGLLVEAAIENNWMVSFPLWEKGIKDASAAAEKYGKLLTLHSILSSAISNKDKIHLKWKLSSNERTFKRNY